MPARSGHFVLVFYFENSFVLLLFYFEFWTENISGAQYFVFGAQAQLFDCPLSSLGLVGTCEDRLQSYRDFMEFCDAGSRPLF